MGFWHPAGEFQLSVWSDDSGAAGAAEALQRLTVGLSENFECKELGGRRFQQVRPCEASEKDRVQARRLPVAPRSET